MPTMPRLTLAGAAAAAVMLALPAAGCQGRAPQTVVVFAAASLSEAFTALGESFTETGTGTVELTVGGSADLLTQLTHGADADVYAAADMSTMDKAVAAGLVDGPVQTFATNTLTIVVAPGNPQGIRGFRDLARVSTVVCAPQVPCGAALPGLQSRTGVQLQPVSEESSVTDVLNKVTSGQAEAGLVYVTDARAAGREVTAVGLPQALVNTYQIAVLKSARDPVAAGRFVDLVSSPAGRKKLAELGFGVP